MYNMCNFQEYSICVIHNKHCGLVPRVLRGAMHNQDVTACSDVFRPYSVPGHSVSVLEHMTCASGVLHDHHKPCLALIPIQLRKYICTWDLKWDIAHNSVVGEKLSGVETGITYVSLSK